MNVHNPLSLAKNRSTAPMYWLGDAKSVTMDHVKYKVVKQDAYNTHLRNLDGVIQEFSHAYIYIKHLENKFSVDRDEAQPSSLSFGKNLVDLDPNKAQRALALADSLNLFMDMQRAGKKHPLLADLGWNRKVTLGRDCLKVLLPIIYNAVEKKWKPTSGTTTFTLYKFPKERQFKRLHDLYVAGNCDPRVLVSRKNGPGSHATNAHPADLENWVKHARLYADKKRPSMRACFGELGKTVERLNEELPEGARRYKKPSRNTFEALIKGMGEFFLHAARYGEDAATKKFAPVREGLTVFAPGQRVEMDEWKIDLFTLLAMTSAWKLFTTEERKALKKIRLWVTVAIDVATRCILALRFSTRAPSAHSSLAALEMVVTSKEHIAEVAGAESRWIHSLIPQEIVTDAGAAFIDASFRAAVATLGCIHTIPPAGMASARGTIESVFRTFGQRYLHYFEGRTFSSPEDRGDYDAEARVVLNVDELCRALTRAIVDIYHHEPHGGLGGETPANAWLRLSREHAMIPPLDQRQRRRIFGTVISRTISARGIRFLNIHYQSPALPRLWAERAAIPNSPTPSVDIRVDRFNIRTISYHDGFDWVDLDTELNLPDNISVWEWTGALDAVAKTHRKNAKINLSTLVKAVNDLRKSGEAAAARAELGTDIISAAAYRKVEMSRYGYDITDDILEQKQLLSALAISHDPLTTSIEEYRFLALNTEEHDEYFKRSELEYPAFEARQDEAERPGDSEFVIDFGE
ncbi:integrase catalytic domain-containing protein [Rhizobium mongolense]|uniref:Transposase n=2 Tax=Rhizobium mongolense TaxID=57676 RepID=A0ABR6IWA6_9HYPH|nr:DDE-type integrase/transposase/recombinase [Rhizobium mongolense]MBB4232200.1 putative transposase [Rhizobium mongolense]TVZ63080.1 integrase-like protein [Rhizobium mongolense USDA 1844]